MSETSNRFRTGLGRKKSQVAQNILTESAVKVKVIIRGSRIAIDVNEFLSLFEQEKNVGYFFCFLVCLLPIIGLLLLALPHVTVSDLPSVTVLLLLIFVPLYGCGDLFKGRPAFQWHYHGVETEVMEELAKEAESLSSDY